MCLNRPREEAVAHIDLIKSRPIYRSPGNVDISPLQPPTIEKTVLLQKKKILPSQLRLDLQSRQQHIPNFPGRFVEEEAHAFAAKAFAYDVELNASARGC